MWSRALGLFIAGLLGACRPQAGPVSSVPLASVPTTQPIPGTPYRATPILPQRQAVLTTEDEGEVTVRSQPTTQSEPVTTSQPATLVTLQQLSEGEGGYSWYYLQLPSGETGWVRGDFINLRPNVVTDPNPVTCAVENLEAWFETRTLTVYICADGSETRYISKAKASGQDFAIDTVEQRQGTYVAVQGDIQYHVNAASLTVYQYRDGQYVPLASESVIRSQRRGDAR